MTSIQNLVMGAICTAVVAGFVNQKAPAIVFLIVTAFAGMNTGSIEIFALASSFSVLLMAYYLLILQKNDNTQR